MLIYAILWHACVDVLSSDMCSYITYNIYTIYVETFKGENLCGSSTISIM